MIELFADFFLQECEYEDAAAMRLDENNLVEYDDTANIHNCATIPLRPAPFVPKRVPSITSPTSEEIFYTLSDIRRESAYNNFDGQNHELAENEKELFDTSTDSGSDTDDETVNKDESLVNLKSSAVNTTNALAGLERGTVGDKASDNTNRNRKIPLESDTSEDSDFIAASFWLRNRIDNNMDSSVPPAVPRRYDSQGLTTLPMNHRVSMAADDLICRVGERSSSEILRSGSPCLVVSEQTVGESVCNGADDFALYDFPRNYEGLGIGNVNDYKSDKRKCTEHKPKTGMLIDFGETNGYEDDTDSYETLVGGNLRPVGHVSNEVDEDIYESTWPENEPDSPEIEKPWKVECEKLTVDMPSDQCGKTASKQYVDTESDYVKPKQNKNMFSRMFSKKSKSKDLPESLEVSLPQGAQGCTEGEDNVYSDFPLTKSEKSEIQIDSDMLKEAIANGPKSTGSDSEIELPKRNFGELASGSHPKLMASQSVRIPRKCAANLYEDVVTEAKCLSNDLPPCPPPKAACREFPQFSKSVVEKPTAPPRKNKKQTGKENGRTCNNAFDSSAYGIEVFNSAASCKIPARPPVSKEPALPPRNSATMSKGKSAESPPTPPRRSITRQDTDLPKRSSTGW